VGDDLEQRRLPAFRRGHRTRQRRREIAGRGDAFGMAAEAGGNRRIVARQPVGRCWPSCD